MSMCALKVSMERFATTKDLTPDTVFSAMGLSLFFLLKDRRLGGVSGRETSSKNSEAARKSISSELASDQGCSSKNILRAIRRISAVSSGPADGKFYNGLALLERGRDSAFGRTSLRKSGRLTAKRLCRRCRHNWQWNSDRVSAKKACGA